MNEFDIIIKDKKIKVAGNKLSEAALQLINKLKVGTIFSIENIRYPNPYNVGRDVVYPIKIMIKN